MRRRWRRGGLGGLSANRRWEIGLPLIILGTVIAGFTVGVRGAGGLFWLGAGLTAVGAGVFFSAPRRS